MLNFENLDKFMFLGIGQYAIPSPIEPTYEYPVGGFIPVNCHDTAKDTKRFSTPQKRACAR